MRVPFICALTSFSLLASTSLFANGTSYKVSLTGIQDDETRAAIMQVSKLYAHKKNPPSSPSALRFRAESDLPEIRRVLRAYGFYEATIQVHIDAKESENKAKVILEILPGPRYSLLGPKITLKCPPLSRIHLPDISKEKSLLSGCPAISRDVLYGEKQILRKLAVNGFPLAVTAKRHLVIDGDKKSVSVVLEIQTKQYLLFGPYNLEGLKTTKPLFVEQYIAWKEGDKFDQSLIEETEETLLKSGVFNSVFIDHLKHAKQGNSLPLKIEVSESKHRTLNLGASYQTTFGLGVTFGWENRNINGMGRRLSIRGDVSEKSQTGIASFIFPEAAKVGQDVTLQAEAAHEVIFAYSQRSYSTLCRFDKELGKTTRFSVGIEAERLYLTHSDGDGKFDLFEVPLYIRWSSAKNLLNPTKGDTIEYRGWPTTQIEKAGKIFLGQQLIWTTYKKPLSSNFLVLAHKLTLGSILSKDLHAIPLSKRFLGGTEEDLRGYKYKTVSPLAPNGLPIGGRSALYYSFEPRLRLSNSIGLVPFFDIGNVFLEPFPTFKGEWRKSVGIGLRYFSFMGPLRFDIGFPLDRREHIDPRYRIFVSIGQTF